MSKTIICFAIFCSLLLIIPALSSSFDEDLEDTLPEQAFQTGTNETTAVTKPPPKTDGKGSVKDEGAKTETKTKSAKNNACGI